MCFLSRVISGCDTVMLISRSPPSPVKTEPPLRYNFVIYEADMSRLLKLWNNSWSRCFIITCRTDVEPLGLAISPYFSINSSLTVCACFIVYTTYTRAFQLVADAVNVTLSSASTPYITLWGWNRECNTLISHSQSTVPTNKARWEMIHLPEKAFPHHHHMKQLYNIWLVVTKDISNHTGNIFFKQD